MKKNDAVAAIKMSVTIFESSAEGHAKTVSVKAITTYVEVFSMALTTSPATASSSSPFADSNTSLDVPFESAITNMTQSLSIRYELTNAGELLSLYKEGSRMSGYTTIEQFYQDMSVDGWVLASLSQVRSCSLHFATMKRDLTF